VITDAVAAPPLYLIGLDLGQAQDYSAWIVAEHTRPPSEEPRYDVRHIDRIRGARYPAIVDHTTALVAALREPVAFVERHVPHERGYLTKEQHPLRPSVHLVVDYTGVGRPVADMLLAAELDCTLTLVTITGGDAVTRGDSGEVRVPKRDLASTVQVLLQSERLRIGEQLPHAKTLTDELVNFKVKISLTGHDSYGAGEDWRQGNHDDLVLALALPCWYGENRLPGPSVAAYGVSQVSDWR
jgi:hypothetical protein